MCLDPSHETHMYAYILWTEMCLMRAKGGLTIFTDQLQTKCTDWVLFNHATGGVISVILQVVWCRFLCFVTQASVFYVHFLSFSPAPENSLNIFLYPLRKLAEMLYSLWQDSLLWCSHNSALMMVVSTQHFHWSIYFDYSESQPTHAYSARHAHTIPTL